MKDPDVPTRATNAEEWIRRAAGKLNRLGRSPHWAVRYVTATTTALDTDQLICCTGTLTVNLPNINEGQYYIIKMLSSGTTVTVDGYSSQTIDGAATKTITVQYNVLRLIGGTTQWHLV